ncbi:hypothetical protein HPP92_003152 [Vanilla planifolia]|uniref:Lipase n=1 Tax=Vanilla planifolia TaxID=51239 RepID=A0A835VJ20_VANPL|nr:hypothetical protein HPP92_003541 [Vanilla planifolia]KAG0503080.1 hypothetical protein HPP92_003152 [Vanilla planifolia]
MAIQFHGFLPFYFLFFFSFLWLTCFSIHKPEGVGICSSVVQPVGYKCEEFEVTTEDGYILGIQRILEGRAGGNGTKRQPVLLQHGVLVDGISWLLNSPEQSLAYVLADNGFDVWIANTRGTRPSFRHISLSPSDKAYWAWSWDELAAHDLPAMIDFILKKTGQKLHYVGHSLGTLIALASLSERREVDKMKSVALLCPVAYLDHMETPLGIVAAKVFLGEILSDWLGMPEFNLNNKKISNFLSKLCSANPGIDCNDLVISFTGNNCCLNASTVDVFLKYEPQPTSMKNMVHLAQTFRDGILRKYDYGSNVTNFERYGQHTPPVYNLSNIPNSLPLFLGHGGKDFLADVKDVEHLLDNLKFHDPDQLSVHYVQEYAHEDFVLGVSAKHMVYESVMTFFRDHQ